MKNSKKIFRQKRKKRIRLWLKRIRFALILAALVFIGNWLHEAFTANDYTFKETSNLIQENVQTKRENAKTISNMTGIKNNKKDIKILKKDLESYIKEAEGQYGIYYYNLVTGDEFGINDKDEYIAASTIKIPLNLYLYTRIKSGSVDPQGILTYLEDDYEEGTGQIRYEETGKTYTIRELSKLSITISDNVAANMLFRFLGINNVKDYMRKAGGIVVKDGENVSCPRDMGLYMKLVYEFYRKQGNLGEELMNNFLNTEFNDRIPALLPNETKVAHKIGTQVGVLNDVGIVITDNPYVLSVMSKEVDEEKAPEVIAGISKKIFDFLASDHGEQE